MKFSTSALPLAALLAASCFVSEIPSGLAQQRNSQSGKNEQIRDEDLPYPPAFANNRKIVTDTSVQFLHSPFDPAGDFVIAETPPTIEFMFYPEQNYPGKPWSNWGDGCVANGKYYSAIGDHYAIGRGEQKYGTGTAFVYEYDPASKVLRSLVDVADVLDLPKGHYTPGKIHSRIDMGNDGWLYYATHRGSTRVASDQHQYRGDWILRTHPGRGTSEVVAHGPVSKHCIPNSVLDPQRMIFYGATAPGTDAESQSINFFAWDIRAQKLLFSAENGPARYMILAPSSGRVYFVAGNADGPLMKFDPTHPNAGLVDTGLVMGNRASTTETGDGMVYSVSKGQGADDAALWEFNTRTETVKKIGAIGIGGEAYAASLDAGPRGRYLYYVPGAHGGGYRVGSPVVQYDVQTHTKKVIAFLHPFYEEKYGFIPKGTYSTALSPAGDKLYVTWNVSRGTKAWDCCALAVIHIPESERLP